MMRGDTGRWILVFIMIICLVVLLCFSMIKSSDEITEGGENEEFPSLTEEAQVIRNKTYLENESLFLINIKDDYIYIDGTGKMTKDDFNALLKHWEINDNEVTNLIIGDGITEIGYKAITNLDYLTTLWIGAGVERISNGAVRDCKKLKYIYLPNTVKRVGMDFLYQCDAITVITNGACDELPIIENYEEKSILEKINSYEDLVLAIKNTPVFSFYPEDGLLSDAGSVIYAPLVLPSGCLQYGPKKNLPAGEWKVKVSGKIPSDLGLSSVYVKNKNFYPLLQNVTITNDSIDNMK